MKKSKNNQVIQEATNASYSVSSKKAIWILFGLSFLMYANTLTHKFTQDDAIVIYDNMFTTQGISGIPGLLKYDTFYGFFKEKGKAKLVSGGRYRPFTPVMFAIERQIFGGKDIMKNLPFWSHLFNVLWFSFLVVLLYKLFEKLLLYKEENTITRIMILIACLIFAVHPIHTEAVANIKGRDEIMALLGSVASLYFILKTMIDLI